MKEGSRAGQAGARRVTSHRPAPFGSRLHTGLRARGRLCVGIDPHPSLLRDWGLGDDAAGLEVFSRTVVDALADRVAVLKPQSAFFERFGSRGVSVLEHVVADARDAGALVVLDVKRGDIGSTMDAYAQAYLSPGSPLLADAITASPYLGFGSLRPALDRAVQAGCGVFVLALTSNPEGAPLQRARREDGRLVAQAIVEEVRSRNEGVQPWGSVGVVVGATVATPGFDLDVNGPILTPGLGAQGGTSADLVRVFGPARRHVLPSASRTVLGAGPDIGSLRRAAARLRGRYDDVLDGA
jgi:orotidine-5'-phosphate decarboxylase